MHCNINLRGQIWKLMEKVEVEKWKRGGTQSNVNCPGGYATVKSLIANTVML